MEGGTSGPSRGEQVSTDGKTLTLSKKVPAGFGELQPLVFPNTVPSWKQYPITRNVTTTRKLGIDSSLSEGEPARYDIESLTNKAGLHVSATEPVTWTDLSGGGTFSGTVFGIPVADKVFVSTFDASLKGKTGTFTFTVPAGWATISKTNLAQTSAPPSNSSSSRSPTPRCWLLTANPEFTQKISNVNNVRYTIEPFRSPSAHAGSPRASTSGLPAAG